MKVKLTEEVRKKAEETGMTPHQLAIEAKLDRNVVYRFMGGGLIRSDSLDALAEFLELQVVKRTQQTPQEK